MHHSSLSDSRLQRSFLGMIARQFWDFKFYYLFALASLGFLHLVQSEIPMLAKELGDKAAVNDLGSVSLWAFVGVALAVLVFRTLSRLLFFYPARIQQRDLRLELMQRLEISPPDNYKDRSDGDIFQVVYSDLNRLRGLVGFGFLQMGNILIAANIFIPKIVEFNASFLWAFLPLVACVVFFMITIYFFQPLVRQNMTLMGNVQNTIMESYDAKATIKNFHAENSLLGLFVDNCQKELNVFFKASLGRTFGIPLVKIGIAGSLLWGALIVREQGLSGTDLIYFSGFLFLIQEPLMFLSWIGVVTSQGLAAWGRIKDLVAVTDKRMPEKEVDLAKMEFDFWGEKISFSLRPESWLILVGDTGVGKSHVMENMAYQLMLGHKSVSFVQQEPFLYSDTIEENIFLGQKDREELKAELRKLYPELGFESLEEDFDQFMQIEVGENGKQLSGGQAKRVALLRSLVSQADFILWDDPFSSVDYIIEQKIIAALKKSQLAQGKTFVLTSHRLTTVRFTDNYILLNKQLKKIEDQGQTSVALEKKDSVLSEYFKHQVV